MAASSQDGVVSLVVRFAHSSSALVVRFAQASSTSMRRRVGLLVLSTVFGIALCGPENVAAPSTPSMLANAGERPDTTTRPPISPDLPGLPDTADPSPAGDAPPVREWRLIDNRHWQIKGPEGEPPEITDARENNRGACAPGMIEVAGRMKQHFILDELQMQACTKWIDKKWPERCGAYDRAKWIAISKDLPTQPLHFCIDRYEYPNRKDAYPIILVNWYEARDVCKAEGKRLCSEDEWTFACEGEEATPYPNGYVREPDACVNDRPWKEFHAELLSPRSSEAAKRELDRLWQGASSGSRPACKSTFGVYDLTGNIDEWTHSSIASERQSVLKGGYWGPVRTRCRPATKAHSEDHAFYQQGFRCCADVGKN